MNKLSFMSACSCLPLYGELNEWVQTRRMKQWQAAGCPLPPPHKEKQRVLRELATAYGLKTFVETGTLFGDMVYAMRNEFKTLYSIEVYEPLFRRATQRFRFRNQIHILNGDSGVVLHELVKTLDSPTLFWLDGHYSGEGTGKGEGDTPIFNELKAIFKMSEPFAIAIDDARLFGTDPGYPSLEQLSGFVEKNRTDLTVTNACDIIQIVKG